MSDDSEAMRVNEFFAGSTVRLAKIDKDVMYLEMTDQEFLVVDFRRIRLKSSGGYVETIAERP